MVYTTVKISKVKSTANNKIASIKVNSENFSVNTVGSKTKSELELSVIKVIVL